MKALLFSAGLLCSALAFAQATTTIITDGTSTTVTSDVNSSTSSSVITNSTGGTSSSVTNNVGTTSCSTNINGRSCEITCEQPRVAVCLNRAVAGSPSCRCDRQ